MNWNHRVIKKMYGNDEMFGIHEVFYNEDGMICAYTQEPVSASSETLEDLLAECLLTLSAQFVDDKDENEIIDE